MYLRMHTRRWLDQTRKHASPPSARLDPAWGEASDDAHVCAHGRFPGVVVMSCGPGPTVRELLLATCSILAHTLSARGCSDCGDHITEAFVFGSTCARQQGTRAVRQRRGSRACSKIPAAEPSPRPPPLATEIGPRLPKTVVLKDDASARAAPTHSRGAPHLRRPPQAWRAGRVATCRASHALRKSRAWRRPAVCSCTLLREA